MKKLSYLVAGMVLSLNASAQLQNMDFESWDFPVTFADPALNRPTGGSAATAGLDMNRLVTVKKWFVR